MLKDSQSDNCDGGIIFTTQYLCATTMLDMHDNDDDVDHDAADDGCCHLPKQKTKPQIPMKGWNGNAGCLTALMLCLVAVAKIKM